MKKRILAGFISLCMIVSLLPVMAFGQGTDNAAASTAVDEYAAETICTCASLCSEGTAEESCPVCSAEDADLSACQGAAPAEAVCTCTTRCTVGAAETACPVCSAEGADLSACQGAAPAAPVCTCAVLCTEDTVEAACPVCAAEDADLSACQGIAPTEPVCSCTVPCTEGAMDQNCPVCGAPGADPTLCSAAPAASPFLATKAGDTGIYVGGVELNGSAASPAYATTNGGAVTPGGSESNYNIKWDGGTLTLKNAAVTQTHAFDTNTAAIYREGALIISLEGDNSISSASAAGGNSYGIYADGMLTFAGGGTITANGNEYGIYSTSSITISGGTVTATSSVAATREISAIYSAAGRIVYNPQPGYKIECWIGVDEASAWQSSEHHGYGQSAAVIANYFQAKSVFMPNLYIGGEGCYGDLNHIFYAKTGAAGDLITQGASEADYNIKWDGETLTLQNASISNGNAFDTNAAAIYREGDMTISLKGTNTVSCLTADGGNSYGVYDSGNLTLSGSGTLTATGGDYGIHATQNITICDGTVVATGSSSGISASSIAVDLAYGYIAEVKAGDSEAAAEVIGTYTGTGTLENITGKYFQSTAAFTPNIYIGNVGLFGSQDSIAYAKTDSDGTVTTEGASAEDYDIMWDGETLTLDGADIDGSYCYDQYSAAAIYCEGDLKIVLKNRSTVTGTDLSDINCYGIRTFANLTISGDGALDVSAGDAPLSANVHAGICGESVTIESGEVTATGGRAYFLSHGIVSNKDLTIAGGKVTAIGGNYDISCGGIVSYGTVIIAGGEVTATGEQSVSGRTILVQPAAGKIIEIETGKNADDATAMAGSPFEEEAAITVSGKYFHSVEKPVPDLYVGGVGLLGDAENVAYAKTDSNGTVTTEGASAEDYNIMWDGETLTLNGADIANTHTSGTTTAAIYRKGNLALSIAGQNTITGEDTADTNSAGIYVTGSITISGTGTVEVTSGTATDYNSYGIYASSEVTITGGEVRATGGDTTANSCGIYADDYITISDSTVHAASGLASTYSYAIYAGKLFTSEDGADITATGGDARFSYGISTSAYVRINGGVIAATGGAASESSFGISALYGVTIYGGEVTATETGQNGQAIRANGGSVVLLRPDENKFIEVETGESADSAQPVEGSPFAYAEYGNKVSAGEKYFHSVEKNGPNLYVGGVGLYGDADTIAYAKTNSDGAVTTDGASASDYNIRWDGETLSLNGATVANSYTIGTDTAAIYREGALKIDLTGENTVTGADVADANSYGIYVWYSDADGGYFPGVVTISGTGSLRVASGASETSGNSYGIYTHSSITISSVVTVEAGQAAVDSFGIYGFGGVNVVGGELTVSGGKANGNSYGLMANSDIELTGGKVSATGGESTGGDSYGIRSIDRPINIGENVESVTATGGTAGANSYGMYSYSSFMTVSGDNVTANGGEAGGNSYGMYADTYITIGDSGSVNAIGGKADSNSYGMYASSALNLAEGGSLTATGDEANRNSYGLYLSNKNAFTGGSVTATGGTAGQSSYGILFANGSTISGGEITATSGTGRNGYGIASLYSGNFSVSGGTVTCTGTTAALQTNGSVTVDPQTGEVIAVRTGEAEASAAAIDGSPFGSSTDITSLVSGANYFQSKTFTMTAITTQPDSVAVTEGQSASFSVSATGGGTLTYQWQQSADNGQSWINIDGATDDTYTIANTTTDMNGTQYRCVVTGIGSQAESSAATLTVYAKTTITAQPADVSVTEGQPASFSVSATGEGTLTYQWQQSADNGQNWTDIAGAITDTYTIANTATDMDGTQYRCVVTGDGGEAESGAATLTVYAKTIVTTAPEDVTVTEEQPAEFSVTATGTNLTYQWQSSMDNGQSWINIDGATDDTYTIANTTTDMNGTQYRCVVTGAGGIAESGAATLTVYAKTIITAQPADVSVTEGQPAEFSVSAIGEGTLSYQWQQSTDDGQSWTNISGATANTYTIASTAMDMNGTQYRCVVTGDGGTAESDAATLTVNLQTVISGQPVNLSVTEGQSAVFSVTATGTNVTYQWQQSTDNGQSWTAIDGATASTYTIENATTAMNGTQYSCVITGDGGVVESEAATLTVSAEWILTISATAQDGKVVVSWAKPDGYEVTGYKLYVKAEGAADPAVPILIQDGEAISYTVETLQDGTPLENGKTYTFYLVATYAQNGETGEIKSNTISAIPNTLYRLTVENGGVGATVDGEYAAQNEVTIHAGTRENSVFLGWTSSNDAVFADASSPDTTFTMPAADTTITANWHTHSWSTEWSSDETSHWHACSGCDEKHEEAEHSFKWVIDKAATATQAGSKHEECSVCGYAKAAVEIPATGASGNPSTGTNRPSGGNRPGGTTSPHTGDERNITLWLGLLLVSGTGLGAAVIYRRKHYNKAK